MSRHPKPLRCPDCRRRGVFLHLKPRGEDCYECVFHRPGKQYSPCAWFAFADGADERDRHELARLWAINPEAQPTV